MVLPPSELKSEILQDAELVANELQRPTKTGKYFSYLFLCC